MKKQIDRFVLIEQLSESGAGSVFRADEVLAPDVRRPVALKVLQVLPSGDKPAEDRFAGELRLILALTGHPNIVTLYGAGIADRVPWLAMEYIQSNLEQVIGDAPAAVPDVVRVLEHVAWGLAAMHSLTPAFLHNDLKPANILIDRFNTCKVTDFGLASQVAVERTRGIATVRYSAPELLSRDLGKVCPATDLYALGHIAYEMALGGRLYRQQFTGVFDTQVTSKDAHPAKWMAWHCSSSTAAIPVHELRQDFPRALGHIIAKLMAKPLHERYESTSQMLADLKAATGTAVARTPAAARPTPATPVQQQQQQPPTQMTPVVSMPAEPQAKPKGFFSRFRSAPAAPASATATTEPTFDEATESPDSPAPATPATPMPGAPMAASYKASGGNELFFVRMRGKLTGPFDVESLKRQVRQGQVSRLHQVSTDKLTWRSAASIEGLF